MRCFHSPRTPPNTPHPETRYTHAQARLPQAVIDPLVDALGRSTLGRSELGMAILQAVGQVVAEKLEIVAEKAEVEKELRVEKAEVEKELRVEKAEVEKEKEKMEKELRVEKAEVEKEKEKMEKELRLEVSGLLGTVKDKETAILRLHGKLSLRGAIGGWVPVMVTTTTTQQRRRCLLGRAGRRCRPRRSASHLAHSTLSPHHPYHHQHTLFHRVVPEREGAAGAWPRRGRHHQRGRLEPVPGPQAGRAGAHRAPDVVARERSRGEARQRLRHPLQPHPRAPGGGPGRDHLGAEPGDGDVPGGRGVVG